MNEQEQEQENPNPTWLVCDDCHKAKPDVVETNCPYQEDINGKIVPCVLCKECYHVRADDI